MLKFSAKMDYKGNKVSAQLDIYTFTNDGYEVVYCPALDISAYGDDKEQAKASFEFRFGEYLKYCLAKNTLLKDLQHHGWKIKSLKQKRVKSPTVQEMLSRNKELKTILFGGKDYVRQTAEVELPELVG